MINAPKPESARAVHPQGNGDCMQETARAESRPISQTGKIIHGTSIIIIPGRTRRAPIPFTRMFESMITTRC